MLMNTLLASVYPSIHNIHSISVVIINIFCSTLCYDVEIMFVGVVSSITCGHIHIYAQQFSLITYDNVGAEVTSSSRASCCTVYVFVYIEVHNTTEIYDRFNFPEGIYPIKAGKL